MWIHKRRGLALNGKVSKELNSSVKTWTEADSLRTLAANRAREELERGSGAENKWTLSCPLVTRAKRDCQICCPGKSCKCNLKKAEGVVWLPWFPLECSRPEEGMASYERGTNLDESWEEGQIGRISQATRPFVPLLPDARDN